MAETTSPYPNPGTANFNSTFKSALDTNLTALQNIDTRVIDIETNYADKTDATNAFSGNITAAGNATVTGTLTATTLLGDGSGLTGIGTGTGGYINTGSTTIGADSDANGTGEIALQTRGSTKMTVANGGNVGIGTTSPNGKLNVSETGTSVVTPNINADGIVLDNSGGNAGISILTPTTGTGSIYFGDNDFAGSGSIYYAHTSDLMGFVTADSINMVLDSSGNVGIGTSSPSAFLDIKTSVDRLQITHSGGIPKIQARNSTDTGFSSLFLDATQYIINTGGTEKMRIDGSGNVGIGTTSPAYPLHVEVGSSISVSTLTNMSELHSAVGYTTERLGFGFFGNENLGVIQCGEGASFNFDLAIQPKGGNVGIGTTNPVVKLQAEIDSSTAYSASWSTVNDAVLRLDNVNTTTNAFSGIKLRAGSADLGIAAVYTGTVNQGDMVFSVDNGVGIEVMRLTNGGNVGIGTTSPTRNLVLYSATDTTFSINNADTGVTNVDGFQISVQATTKNASIIQRETADLITYVAGSEVMRIDSSGNVNISGLTASSDVQTDGSKNLVSVSDMRLKNDLGEFTGGLEKITKLKPRYFQFKSDIESGSEARQLGFFAQEVFEVLPEAAPREPVLDEDGNHLNDEDGSPDYKWGFNGRPIIAALVDAIKEMKSAYDSKVTELESRITALGG